MLNWKDYEGEVVSGEFPLERYLGGSETRAVFLTRFGEDRAAVKLEAIEPLLAGELVERWNRAAALHHEHLAGIHAAGTWTLGGVPLAYLVTEHADENLAEVLRERPLTTDEAREMLPPVADALAYLHGQGLVHGDLRPSNILAVGDTVKISSETVSAGDPAEDIRALGATLVEALTQRADPVVSALPFPFGEMAEHCLTPDPGLRWSAGKIAAWLRSPEEPAPSLPEPAAPALPTPAAPALPEPAAQATIGKPRTRYYVAAAGLVVAAAAIVGGVAMHRTAGPAPSAGEPVRPTPVSVAPIAPPPSGQPAAPPTPVPTPSAKTAAKAPKSDRHTASREMIPPAPVVREAKPTRSKAAAQDGITHRVLPEIPAKARNTVQGKATVVIRVTVDPAGNVTKATWEPGGSPYFGKLALEAARHWRFAPEEGARARTWILRFEIMRTNTQVIPRRAGRE